MDSVRNEALGGFVLPAQKEKNPGRPVYPFKKPVWNVNKPHGPVKVKNKSLFIQIDGLSYAAFQMAFRLGLIPQPVRDYFRECGYRFEPFYCGQESATPTSTAGFLYGTSQGVPSFRFKHKATGRFISATQGDNIKKYLVGRQPGLLQEGTVYTMFFDGDSKASNFVAELLSLPGKWREAGKSLARISKRTFIARAGHLAILALKAAWSFMENVTYEIQKGPRGLNDYKDVVRNSLVQTFLGVILMDLSTRGVKHDLESGTPVIWVNFTGYDNMSHFFGPFSKQALKALKFIFEKIDVLVRTVRKGRLHDYHVYLLSDHGQVPSETFRRLYGETLSAFIARMFGSGNCQVAEAGPHAHVYFDARARNTVPKGPCFAGTNGRLNKSDIEGKYPGAVAGLIQHAGIGLVAARQDGVTVIVAKEGELRVRNGKILQGSPGILSTLGEPEIVAFHIDREASMISSGHLILYGNFLPTLDGSGFCVDFEDHFWRGNHGGIGGHQGLPFIAYAARDSINTKRIMGSWDLHYQFYDNLTGTS